ncbi:hypothetical protein EVJ18_13535 [Exiguobacterium sp. IPCH1]|nr:hypothetical protein EVJ19_13545 [Exiguobacterium sp. IPCI3]TCI76714.1 hypothetical protein EVJ18_13535 [Exiguobacterium sp. IPCH1]TCI78365.1 hypothetical protein EVJ17_13535 [Exiguobacterium sp. IPBC4]
MRPTRKPSRIGVGSSSGSCVKSRCIGIENGVIIRTVYEQVPPKVVYSLSDYGWSLQPILDAMCDWGEGHIEQTGEDVIS